MSTILVIIAFFLALLTTKFILSQVFLIGDCSSAIGWVLGVFFISWIVEAALLNYILDGIISGVFDIVKLIILLIIIIIMIGIDFFAFNFLRIKFSKVIAIVVICILLLIECFIVVKIYDSFFDQSSTTTQNEQAIINNQDNSGATQTSNNTQSSSNENTNQNSSNTQNTNTQNSNQQNNSTQTSNQSNNNNQSNNAVQSSQNNSTNLLNLLFQQTTLNGVVSNTKVTLSDLSSPTNNTMTATEKYSGCDEIFNLSITQASNNQLQIIETYNGQKTGEYNLSYNQSSNQLFGTFTNESNGKVSNAVFTL